MGEAPSMLENTFSTVCHQSAMCVRAQGYQQALTASRLQTMKNSESTNEVLSVWPAPAPLPDRKCRGRCPQFSTAFSYPSTCLVQGKPGLQSESLSLYNSQSDPRSRWCRSPKGYLFREARHHFTVKVNIYPILEFFPHFLGRTPLFHLMGQTNI